MVIDPVCQMEFEPDQAAARLSYGEDAYYFCSLTCRDRFLDDPGYWLREEEEEEEGLEVEI